MFNNENFTILCVYRLHETNLSIFVERLGDILNDIKIKNLILLGDFNIGILKNKYRFGQLLTTYVFLWVKVYCK